ncbi:hypothetical protein C2S52_018027 [Perilla frutescens var. hirtella]|uniref:Phytosulfokine n=1 Tax=Perilla frutescens var. hirtella TaxID=608512 RepID=A0AAD4IYS5_PERFH|nr:hypothetical protein C2S52_018027 [Perilla frutescens var. hirtella]KAH6811772.1 hypothetical protein C2S51_025534 [Perilla frutescens var. frutescens]KAH6823596.1 hypothetical protein C2S53_006503 [Perilla frutescens var. hirtella]
MAKIIYLCIITLFLFLTLSGDVIARPEPNFSGVTPVEIHSKGGVDEENCGGGEGEEECLRRRTLEAHLDYIYTQKQKQP